MEDQEGKQTKGGKGRGHSNYKQPILAVFPKVGRERKEVNKGKPQWGIHVPEGAN